ncbi:hypothetical protein DAEQUDRAFT_373981 [Daedalea quercina L-15889]|uniref:Uncharacterized protein n=1 Tax=Daedalea quercina L-15889 TaxID=1314783 RepID=A0A165P6S2_9APHY|nr:hypothetical protein DAEQUDRAFT_373981 [Daedalea quercina L-15889]
MPASHKIPKPKPLPDRIEIGDSSFFATSMMMKSAFTRFRNLVKQVAEKYLDLDLAMRYQDQHMLKKHFTEVAKLWGHEGRYEGDWPICEATKLYLMKSSGSRRWNAKLRYLKGLQKQQQDKKSKKVEGITTTSSDNVHGWQEHVSNFVTARRCQSMQSSSAALRDAMSTRPRAVECGIKQHAARAAHAQRAQLAIPDTKSVRAWFHTIDPDPLIDKLIELGIKNLNRLHALASLPDRDQWITRYLGELDQFEF